MEEYTACDTCYAMVLIEYLEGHLGWHEDIRDFIRDTANPAA